MSHNPLKVFMLPTPDEARNDTTNAINQIVLRLAQHLPKYGVEVVSNRSEADLIAGHAGQTDGTRVDVAHTHGLYPTADASITTGWHWAANKHVKNNLVGARAITVPSQWVAEILRRDMHTDPHVIGWGVDADEFTPGVNGGYVLWNKTRTDGVCDPAPLIALAARAPDTLFLTTFGSGTPNIRETGRVVFQTMREMVRNAAVYLATTKETFGIGTLEAMAAGVPILGYAHGGTADIVQHGVTGYLVAPGDLDGLRLGLDYCLKHREILGNNAREVARGYTWDKVARQFAGVYKAAMQPHVGPKVSVVIPCYNYSRFVADAIASVAEQRGVSHELIVVNDGSTDDSKNAILKAFDDTREQGAGFQHVTELFDIPNGGVAHARNFGIEMARGEYIVCLDADDKLANPLFLKTLADALDMNPALGIVFTGLRMMDVDGNPGNMADWPNGYNYDQQVIGRNQVPTCCMFRREAWQRAGGFRAKYTPAEDAELWLRIGALGYKAEQVTRDGWFMYRLHSDSLSSVVRTGQKKEPDWLSDKPWIANGNRPFASDGYVRHSWPVRNYDRPKVSVVIPVGPYHAERFREAVDSIESQTETQWEVIVVNDTGAELDLRGMPYVTVLTTGGGAGAAKARNIGISASRGQFVAFLDADDLLSPRFLELALRHYAIYGRYVYTDWLSETKSGQTEIHTTPEYDPALVFRSTILHSINILIPKADLLKVSGFDESMGSWEDVDLFMKLAKAGICGQRLAEPLMTYRYQSGQLRERGEKMKPELTALLRERYGAYMLGELVPMCCGAGPKKGVMTSGGVSVGGDASAAASVGDQSMIRIVYNGPIGPHEALGLVTKKRYGRRENGDVFYVYAEDQNMEPEKFVPLANLETVEPTPEPPAPVSL
jgi:glycosyltransferase involved in cell wall biosynthesis